MSPARLEIDSSTYSFVLECSHNAPGVLFPTYSWTLADGRDLPVGRHEIGGTHGETLTVQEVVASDAGQYVCTVDGGLGSTTPIRPGSSDVVFVSGVTEAVSTQAQMRPTSASVMSEQGMVVCYIWSWCEMRY